MPLFGGKGGRVDAITGEGRVLGVVGTPGSIADLLNKRALIPLTDAQTGPVKGSMSPVAKADLDPYDAIVVGAASGEQPVVSALERSEMGRLRVPYDVTYQAGSIKVSGVVYAMAGHNPLDGLDRGAELAFPIFDLTVTCDGAPVPFARESALLSRPNVKPIASEKHAA
jgi:hypothetical protein